MWKLAETKISCNISAKHDLRIAARQFSSPSCPRSGSGRPGWGRWPTEEKQKQGCIYTRCFADVGPHIMADGSPQPRTQPRQLYVLTRWAPPLLCGPAETRAHEKTRSGLCRNLAALLWFFPEDPNSKVIQYCQFFTGREPKPTTFGKAEQDLLFFWDLGSSSKSGVKV